MATHRLKPNDRHVTRKELLAELLILARASDASIALLRAEMEQRLASLGPEQGAPYLDVNPGPE